MPRNDQSRVFSHSCLVNQGSREIRGIALFLAANFLGGCGSLPKVCEPNGAKEAGYSAAMRGEALLIDEGRCPSESQAGFKQSFGAGFQEGHKVYCDPKVQENRAFAQAQAGEKVLLDVKSFRNCENGAAIQAGFAKGMDAGLGQFCAESKIRTSGQTQGEAGSPARTLPDETYAICGPDRLGRLRVVYGEGYEAGLKKFCRGDAALEQGYKEGLAGDSVGGIEARYRVCPQEQRAQAMALYEKNYERGLAKFCAVAGIEAQARKNASLERRADLPDNLEVCLKSFPDRAGVYAAVFNAERGKVVAQLCTAASGMEHGRTDGLGEGAKDTRMPVYCDPAPFELYLKGYLEGWRTTKEKICDTSKAYNLGLKEGESLSAANYLAPSNCPGDYGSDMERRYAEGYNQGRVLSKNFELSHQERPGWDCSTTVISKSGLNDFNRCPSGSRFACYRDLRQTCREKSTDKTETQEFRQFTGRCGYTLPECW